MPRSEAAKTTAIERIPERLALAEAILLRDQSGEKARQAAASFAEINGKYHETALRWSAAEDAVAAARGTLQEAQRAHGGDEASMIADALGRGLPMPREALAKSERELALAIEAKALGKEGRDRAEGVAIVAKASFERASEHVATAIDALFRTRLPDLIEAAEKARDDYTAKRAIVALVGDTLDGVTRNYGIIQDAFPVRVRSFLNSNVLTCDRGAEAWKEARKALTHDADAPLPA